MIGSFKALVSREALDGTFSISIEERSFESLPEGEVLIKVHYSSLNYKDTLSARGHKGITRNYPHTPGIDACGLVVESKSPLFNEGDEVFVTGYDLGMNTSGGFSEYIKVPANWIVSKPKDISFRDLMVYGTAGFTAATAIAEFRFNGIQPDSGKVLVSGATGGVGTLAIAMLAKLGYYVTASTGKPEKKEDLLKLGASEVIHRDEINDKSGKALLSKRWIAALDNVGGNTLSTIFRSMDDYGVLCNCGMVESTSFSANVFPLILRAVKLVGIASADTPMRKRLDIWNKIFTEYRLDDFRFPIKEVTLETLPNEIEIMAKGGQVGKVLVKIN